jgi:hypothetical protein
MELLVSLEVGFESKRVEAMLRNRGVNVHGTERLPL